MIMVNLFDYCTAKGLKDLALKKSIQAKAQPEENGKNSEQLLDFLRYKPSR